MRLCMVRPALNEVPNSKIWRHELQLHDMLTSSHVQLCAPDQVYSVFTHHHPPATAATSWPINKYLVAMWSLILHDRWSQWCSNRRFESLSWWSHHCLLLVASISDFTFASIEYSKTVVQRSDEDIIATAMHGDSEQATIIHRQIEVPCRLRTDKTEAG
jgi:hypothetical protein